MNEPRSMFPGPSEADRLVPRAFLPYGDQDPALAHQIEARRLSLDADIAAAKRTADATLVAALYIWRAIRLFLRPLVHERPIVVRTTVKRAEAKDISEAA
jgi:hypothetical protein